MLVIDRRGREIQTNHSGQARRPHPGSINYQFGLDVPFVCDHFRDLAFGRKFEARHTRVCVYRYTQVFGELHHTGRGRVWIELSVAGQVDGAIKFLVRDLRHVRHRFLWPDDFAIQSQRFGTTDAAFEILELLRAGGHAQTANMVEQAQFTI